MKSEAVILAKEQTRRETLLAVKETGLKLLGSPLVQLFVFCCLVEVAQSIPLGKDENNQDKHLISPFLGGGLETLAVSTTTLNAIAGSLDNLSPLLKLLV